MEAQWYIGDGGAQNNDIGLLAPVHIYAVQEMQ